MSLSPRSGLDSFHGLGVVREEMQIPHYFHILKSHPAVVAWEFASQVRRWFARERAQVQATVGTVPWAKGLGSFLVLAPPACPLTTETTYSGIQCCTNNCSWRHRSLVCINLPSTCQASRHGHPVHRTRAGRRTPGQQLRQHGRISKASASQIASMIKQLIMIKTGRMTVHP